MPLVAQTLALPENGSRCLKSGSADADKDPAHIIIIAIIARTEAIGTVLCDAGPCLVERFYPIFPFRNGK